MTQSTFGHRPLFDQNTTTAASRQSRAAQSAARRRLSFKHLSLPVLVMLAACGSGSNDTGRIEAGSPLNVQSVVSTTDGFGAADGTRLIPTTLTNADTSPEQGSTSQLAGKAIAPNDVCHAILRQNRTLLSGQENALIPNSAQPALHSAYQDPIYHSCIVRVTDNSVSSGRAYRRNDYSRRQAFNADSTYMLIYSLNGYWYVHDARTMQQVQQLQGPAGAAEAHWHPTDPNLIWYLSRDGVGLEIHQIDVRTNQSRRISDMRSQVKAIWPSATTASTRAEGAPSADGRYWCFQAERNGGNRILGVFTWDMQAQRIVGSLSLNERPDHVSMSPSGNYCVVSSDGALGTRAYTRDFQSAHPATGRPWLQLQRKSEHSDIAIDRNGQDAYVSVDYGAGDIFSVNLHTGKRTSLFSAYPGRTVTAMHFSGKAYRKPGWVLVSTYAAAHADNPSGNIRNTSQQQWLHRKMFAVSLDEAATIRPIAHVDSNYVSASDFHSYWTEPHATVNPDFTRMLFNSTWNSNNARDVQTYLTAIPEGALDR
ncbi:MAG: hypothetical protein Q4A16_01110 [Lautropia sp.]|nr:hypothetical protein [Lautropia sp.]